MAAHPTPHSDQPDAGLIFETLNSFQKSMALKGAIDLDLFTNIGNGATTVAAIAERSNASQRGVRILCDFLTIIGFLTKTNGSGDPVYELTQNSAMFLNKRSPAYLGSMANFLVHDKQLANFRDVAALVRKGGSIGDDSAETPDNPMWVEFARSMAPMAAMSGKLIAPMVCEPGRPIKVLDIAAGHGLYGISVALYNPAAQVVAVDWSNVLEVASENARRAGVAERYRTIPGSAFEVDLGTGYDVVLIPNFLHHFDIPTNVSFLKKVRTAMKSGGLVATPEFVPNEDRVTPREAASFSFIMLAATHGGDAYTFPELDRMFRDAGFGESRLRSLDPVPQQLILTANK
jgi:2-polyprenyl-3-methyl-5-hydroxy-6-metoxy-1,4-benzoquinol methylase